MGHALDLASLCWRGLLGRRQGVCPRATGKARPQNLEAKIGARRRSISRKERKSAPYAQPSRIPPQGRKPAVAVAPVLRTKSGPLAAFEREPSPNQTVA